jgi:hypothetical protein
MGARANAVLRSEALEDFSRGKLDAGNVSKAGTGSFAPLKVCRRRAHSPTRRFAFSGLRFGPINPKES